MNGTSSSFECGWKLIETYFAQAVRVSPLVVKYFKNIQPWKLFRKDDTWVNRKQRIISSAPPIRPTAALYENMELITNALKTILNNCNPIQCRSDVKKSIFKKFLLGSTFYIWNDLGRIFLEFPSKKRFNNTIFKK